MKTLSEISLELPADSLATARAALDYAQKFTQCYQETEDRHPALREAELLGLQARHIFQPIQEGDRFAGRVQYGLVGLSPEPCGLGYYCRPDALKACADVIDAADPGAGAAGIVKNLVDFWKTRTTEHKVRAAYPPEVTALLPSDDWVGEPGVAFPLYRMAGTHLDYELLLAEGYHGLYRRTMQMTPDPHAPFAEGCRKALEVFRQVIGRYQQEASVLENEEIGEDLEVIDEGPPKTLAQAIQLLWLYALLAGTWNYGRLDDILGPFLVDDLKMRRLTRESATQLLCGFWQIMAAYDNQYNNRVFIGGRGRKNPNAADEFALLAMEATRRVRLAQPQLSLRFSRDQAPRLLEKAYDLIGEGCTYPILYNDDVNIPAVAKAFDVPEDMATTYLPFGCGEYVLGTNSVGSPNGVINLLTALNQVLLDGDPSRFETFDDLWRAYTAHVEKHVKALARQQAIEYEVTAAESPFLVISMLMGDCLERGKSVFAGGARYLGGTLETYGNTNTADALTAIRQVVFEEKRVTLSELAEALAKNFEGQDALRERLWKAPKYGNDDDTADAMAQRVHQHVCRCTRAQAAKVGLHSYLVVVINNWANTVLGQHTGASADGRAAGQPMANGNNPSPGADQMGVTAFLKSLASLDPTIHAGTVQNMKFSKDWFAEHRRQFDALMQTYFAMGGTQAMITVVSRDDLESAMEDPENWGHLMVRVGGFSIRFVDLPREAQQEVLQRTLY